MLDQLDLSPMVVVLLLLYGLLLAVCLVVWTALDMGGGRRKKAVDSTAQVDQPANARPARAQRPAASATGKGAAGDLHRQPADKPPVTDAPIAAPAVQAATAPLRRAADSDSVVSYSVKPRVSAPLAQQSPPKATETQQREPENRIAAPEPASSAGSLRAPQDAPAAADKPATAAGEFLVGRNSRQPRSDSGSTVRPSGAGQETRPGKGEDAFERFLRSSRNDSDDY